MLSLALALTTTAASPVVQIVVDGKPQVVIVSQLGATAAEVHAARDLATHLGQITGVSIPVQLGATSAPSRAIIVGQGVVAKKVFPKVDFGHLGSEELVMKSSGGRLLLAGGRPRGTLYAVYRWLYEQAGVRWWTPWSQNVPSNPKLAIKSLDVKESPAFEARDPFWFHAFDADWSVRNGSNSQSSRLDAERGGKLLYGGGLVHTFFPLVPPDKYFKDHPEWYSLINGNRQADGAQLCTTNPELRDFVVQRVREVIKANPEASIISVSQNDQYGPCECPTCKALDDAEGTHAASVLALANYVAEKIEKEYPNVAIDTLAYQYTRKAPKTIKPRPNVIVRLCSIECNFAQPLDGKFNDAFMQDLRDWSKLTNRLYVWDYVTDFPNYIMPFPNYRVLGPNLRLFAQNGVIGVFEEGAYQSTGAEMAELRAWLLAQLLWNPNQDDKALTKEFLVGYYGAAARPIQEYLDLMADAAKDENMVIWVGPTSRFFSFDVMMRAEKLFVAAEKAVKASPDLLWRVKQAELAPHTVWLNRWDEYRKAATQAGVTWPFSEDKRVFGKQWLNDAISPGPAGWTPVTHMSESGVTPQQWLQSIGAL